MRRVDLKSHSGYNSIYMIDTKTENAKAKKKHSLLIAFHAMLDYISSNLTALSVYTVTFILLSFISFFNVTTSNTIISFSLSDYEVGQVADRTIKAVKTLPGTADSPTGLEKGEKITRKGFPISEEDFEKLKKMAETRSYIDYRAFANSFVYLLLVVILWGFLFTPVIQGKNVQFGELAMIAACLIFVYGMTTLGNKIPFLHSPYTLPVIVPSAMCVMLISVMFGQIPAVCFSVIAFFCVIDITVNSISPDNVIAPLFLLASSIASARIMHKISRRIDIVLASILLMLLNCVFMAALKIIFSAEFSDWTQVFPLIAFSGFISGILTLGFLTPLELLLNTSSVFRLMDLSDLNNPLMRRLMLTASGTYSHSLMVATLAENACNDIGANAILARVGAYYHDIGKMDQSEYFVENKSGKQKNDTANPRLYASVIRSHVRKGVEKCRHLHLPQAVIDIVAEHHGNSLIAYFFNEAKKRDKNVTEEEFSYQGNPPHSRESAVVMLADTVEAACRTLEKPTAQRLEKFILQLIMTKVEHGQLDQSDLTFRDLEKIRLSFVQVLAGYYHTRIEYPNQKDPDAVDDEPTDTADKVDRTDRSEKVDRSDRAEKKKQQNVEA
ncbi:MAG: hypothetical protein Ta2A_17270 [Treponemataceae bacterium]|nr:MAG: hypothetical protein Ta2A_17270 [Treponemataceae bacterium]